MQIYRSCGLICYSLPFVCMLFMMRGTLCSSALLCSVCVILILHCSAGHHAAVHVAAEHIVWVAHQVVHTRYGVYAI